MRIFLLSFANNTSFVADKTYRNSAPLEHIPCSSERSAEEKLCI